MMLARRVTDFGEVVPVACCDVCLKPIEDIGLGMTIWFDAIDRKGETTILYTVHKGICDKVLVAQKGGDGDGGWHELGYTFDLFLEFRKKT